MVQRWRSRGRVDAEPASESGRYKRETRIDTTGLGKKRGPSGRWVADRKQKRSTCRIFTAYLLTEAVLFVHLLWCVWALLGWTVTLGRPRLRALHIASILYGVIL